MIPQSKFHSIPKQTLRLKERHTDQTLDAELYGIQITVDPGVYQTSGDTELMIESVRIGPEQNFLEVGCGSGIVSVAMAQRSGNGVGVDINQKAVANSKKNAATNNVLNVEFLESDVFKNVKGSFDVLICNPPYTKHEARDTIDRMFWDPEDEMKRIFFKEASLYLKPNGRIYFGWADFADIDVQLPFKLAEENGYTLMHVFKKHHKTDFTFYVLEFKRSTE